MHATVDHPTSSATDIALSPSASILSTSPPAVSVSDSPNEHGPSPLRRLKSKSSLWSIGSSNQDDDFLPEPSSAEKNSKPNIFRRLSPALAARVKLLDGSSKTLNNSNNNRNAGAVGRIPEQHLKELDSLHQDLSIKVEKRGQAWAGPTPTSPDETPTQKRTVSNRLELPSLDLLREVNEAYAQGSGHTDVVVEGPETSVQAAAEPPVTAPHQTNSPPPTSMYVAEPLPVQLGAGPESESLPNDGAQDTRTDFEKYVDDTKRSEEQSAPSPPPKDRPSGHNYTLSSSSNTQSYFNSTNIQRPESIYSFSRASFSNQLSQLTSIPLPQPTALETSIKNIQTALAAVRALHGHADQIQYWIKKASDVLSGLDAEDDVEWAAAGGREGLDGVDKAITRFESLVNVYVTAIENVQLRDDVATVDSENLKTIVSQMESILQNWAQIKSKLRGVKQQVELAMEWEELWSNVLGDVGMEIDNLSGMIFEMEEKRHQALMDNGPEASGGVDINELETIVEESPSKGRSHGHNRMSLGAIMASASNTPIIKTPQDDSTANLMALFARMQPLRASLDFLPMRLSMFQSRAESIFPSACEELDDRKERLEKSFQVLQTDSEALQKELGEDKWIMVFRNAGSQAQKMFESVERSLSKLQEGLETNSPVSNPGAFTKRIETYETKKTHYLPAIERVITIIQKGINDRLTLNGEVLRLLSDMKSRTDALKASIRVMDASLEDVQIVRGQQLRDSISSIVTVDSPAAGSAIDTPGSSPASSVIIGGSTYKTPLGGSSRRESSAGSSTTRSNMSNARRFSSLPQPITTGRKSAIPVPSGMGSPPPSKASYATTPTPASRRLSRTPQPPSTVPNRPRWNPSFNTRDVDTGHNFKTLSAITPSTHRKSSAPPRTTRPSSTMAFRRDMSASPAPGAGPGGRSLSRLSSRLASSSRSPSRNITSPTPVKSSLLDPPPYSRLRRASGVSSSSGMSNTPRSRQSFAGVFSRSVSSTQEPMDSPTKSTRPGTALGHSGNKRMSLLPLPRPRAEKDRTAAQKKLDARPPWRA
ncbi:hypothetical protein VI817_004456 [Penicillium citrinum]|nr:hypothetical protein VI817_004456 [Penicillium citrinum]